MTDERWLADRIAERGGAEGIDAIREAMGTAPSAQPTPHTRFFRGVEGIVVDMVDAPRNPYKALFSITAATWGNAWARKKWARVTPEARFFVVRACLDGAALPNGMEAPSFTFEICGLSRSAFDQIARARLGVVIGSMGVRDNNHVDGDFRVPEAMWTSGMLDEIRDHLLDSKVLYAKYLRVGRGNWQDARALMEMSMVHRFSVAFNYIALRGFAGKRMQACEQADTVATAWLIRERVARVFPLLAAYLRPSCDGARTCTYHRSHTLSEAFGCLFRGCGRWPEADDGYATFNESCSDYPTMARQAGFRHFPGDAALVPQRYEELDAVDRGLFEEPA